MEEQRRKNYGLSQIGQPGDRPYDRTDGDGFVAERAGDYADALSKGHGVLLLLAESTGALAPAFIKLLRILAKSAALPTGGDTTVYGESRASHHAFFPHHLAAISAAIVAADSASIASAAASRAFMQSLDASALRAPQRARRAPLPTTAHMSMSM